jgi:hypothetical protein
LIDLAHVLSFEVVLVRPPSRPPADIYKPVRMDELRELTEVAWTGRRSVLVMRTLASWKRCGIVGQNVRKLADAAP